MILLGENLLNADTIGHGTLRLNLERLDPMESVAFVAGKHQRSAALKRIAVTVAAPMAVFPPLMVRADRTALVQVLDNLVSNAVKYSPPGGEVTLGVEPVSGSNRVRFYVRDTGPGLTGADQEKLFSPFTPLSSRPTARENSFGLGLWIVRRVTEAMGGEVAYGANPHSPGACFNVSLPMVA